MKVPHFTIVLLLTIFTQVLLNIYTPIHWKVLSNTYLITHELMPIETEGSDPRESESISNERLIAEIEAIKEGGHTALRYASLYHLTGLMAFVFGLAHLKQDKTKLRFASFIFGMYALFLAAQIM